MEFTPQHNDLRTRSIYGSLMVLSLAFMYVGTGILHAVLMSLSFIGLAVGLFMFIRSDLTSFSYIVRENGEGYDFYINKVTGKRGAYVCYYPLSDAVLLEEYKKGKKKELYEKYGKVFVYNYCHNKLVGEKQILMFKNNGYYDAVIIELDKPHLARLNEAMQNAKRNMQNEENE